VVSVRDPNGGGGGPSATALPFAEAETVAAPPRCGVKGAAAFGHTFCCGVNIAP